MGECHGFFRTAAQHVRFSSSYNGEIIGPLMLPQGSPIYIRVARGSAALLSIHCRGIRPQDALKGESRGLSRVVAGNPGFPRLVPVTSGSFSLCLLEVRNTVDLEGPLGLHWVWCNGRVPHLQLRREPQVSFPVLMWVLGCVFHFKQGDRSRHV